MLVLRFPGRTIAKGALSSFGLLSRTSALQRVQSSAYLTRRLQAVTQRSRSAGGEAVRWSNGLGRCGTQFIRNTCLHT